MKSSVAVESIVAEPVRTLRGMRPAAWRRIRIELNLVYSWPTIIGTVLFIFVACAYYVSPVHYLSDSGFSLLMDEAIIHQWTPNMIRYQVPRGHGGIFVNDGYPWNLEIIKGRLLYVYPWGSSLLSLPAVALFNAEGFKIAPHKNGYKYDYEREVRMQGLIATGVCAFTILLFYETAGCLLPIGWSLAIALSAAFGTAIWSSASRSLWPQTWAVLLITIAIWILLSGRRVPFLLGSVVAWSCFVRPQVIPDVAAISGYVFITYNRQFLRRYVSGGLCWAIPLCTIMYVFTGGLFSPWYSPDLLDFPHDFWNRFYGVTFSPSRGLFVFSPVALVPLYLVLRYWKVLPYRRLAILALAIISMHILMLSSFFNWWGGGCYGPRLLLEVVPWFVLLSIVGLRSALEHRGPNDGPRVLATSITAVALAVSIGTNGPGALVPTSTSINWRSLDPADHPDALWDWHNPQFLWWIEHLQK